MRTIATNPKWLFVGRALTEAKTLNAIVTLFYLARGVSLDQIFLLSLVFSLASLAFEVPSGYLADKFGRKKTLILGVIFLILFNIGSIVAHGFPQFGLLFLLLALSGSCFSGTEEALLYDGLKETGQESKMSKYNGQLHAARSVLKIFLPTLGALIAWNLAEWQFVLLIGLDILASLGAMWCFAQLVEPQHRLQVLTREFSIFRQSLATIRQHPFLFRSSMNKTLVFLGGTIMWRIYQPILTNAGMTAAGLALFYFLLHVASFALRYSSDTLEKRFGLARIFAITPIIMLAMLVVFFLSNNAWVLFATLLVAIIAEVSREPLFAPMMNAHITSESRATTLSNLNLLKGLLDVPILLACSALAIIDPKYPMYVVIVITLIALFAFPIRQRDLA